MAKPPVWIPHELSSLPAFHLDCSARRAGRRSRALTIPQFADHLAELRHSSAIAIACPAATAFARFPVSRQVGDSSRPDADAQVPGIALSLPLFIVYAGVWAFLDTHGALILTYVALNVPLLHLVERLLLQAGPERSRRGPRRSTAARVGGVFGGFESRFAGRRIASAGILSPLSDLMERIRAGFAADALRPPRDISGRPAGLYVGIPSTGRGMCALAVIMIAPALTLTSSYRNI